MSANDYSAFYIDSALQETVAGRDVAAARVERLLRAAFEDGDRAVRAYAGLATTRGAEGVIQVLQSDGLFGRHWHFGWMKGGWLARGNRQTALTALRELPEAVHAHQQLVARCADLKRAGRDAAERIDRERLRTDTPLLDIVQSHTRKLH